MEFNFNEFVSKAYDYIENNGYTKNETGKYIVDNFDSLPEANFKDTDNFIAWIDDKVKTRNNDYYQAVSNLRMKKKIDSEKSWELNTICSAINSYFRELKQQKERDNNPSTYQGEIGSIVTFTVKEAKPISYGGNYWYDSTFWRIVGTDDNIYMWSTSADFGEGDTIAAKVKAHKDYRGEKQTIITRGKVINSLQKEVKELPDDDREYTDFSNSVLLSDIYSTE